MYWLAAKSIIEIDIATCIMHDRYPCMIINYLRCSMAFDEV